MRRPTFRFSFPTLCSLALMLAVILLTSCASAGPSSTPTSTPPAAPPGIVAYIGASPVTEAQWEQARAYAEATLRLLGEPGAVLDEEAVLESFVEDLFITREADEAGFQLADAIVNDEENRILSVAGRAQKELDEILTEVGLTRTGWRTELQRAVLAANYLEDVILADTPPGQRPQQRSEWLTERKKALGVQLIPDFEPLEGLGIGDLAPDITLQTLAGETLKLSDLRGQAVILNFWATWCHPCRKEMPLLIKAYEQHQVDGLNILAVNVGESTAAVQGFADEFDIEFLVGLDADQSVTKSYRIFGMPTTFFINRQGVIDYVVAGAIREPDLDRLVDVILQDSVGAP